MIMAGSEKEVRWCGRSAVDVQGRCQKPRPGKAGRCYHSQGKGEDGTHLAVLQVRCELVVLAAVVSTVAWREETPLSSIKMSMVTT